MPASAYFIILKVTSRFSALLRILQPVYKVSITVVSNTTPAAFFYLINIISFGLPVYYYRGSPDIEATAVANPDQPYYYIYVQAHVGSWEATRHLAVVVFGFVSVSCAA